MSNRGAMSNRRAIEDHGVNEDRGAAPRVMGAEERRQLWTELSLLEDWLSGGPRRKRPEPDFSQAASLAAARSKASAAPPRVDGCEPRGRAGPERDGSASIAELGAEAARCAACRLAAGRSRVVFGEGSASPIVLVVGEGPGAEEDATGRPFVGPAGRLLDRMLESIGLSRTTNVYIANVVKCRPPMNRDPAPDEQAACRGFLRKQAALLRPSYVLCLGRVAAQALTGSKDGINRLRGRWLEFEGLPLIATFHPSALLRDDSLKRPAWEDLKMLRSRMEADGELPATPPTAAAE
jgi:uracil-DNA glycosylase family 4